MDKKLNLSIIKIDIIQKINSFFGYKVIHDIKIISFEEKTFRLKISRVNILIKIILRKLLKI